jgi:hypothetical protein
VGGDGEDEAEAFVEDFFGKRFVRLTHVEVIRHRIAGTKAEEVTERPTVGAAPGDRSVRLQAFEVADEEHPEQDAGRHARSPRRFGVVGGTEFLEQRVEAAPLQQAVECRVERMAWRFRQV